MPTALAKFSGPQWPKELLLRGNDLGKSAHGVTQEPTLPRCLSATALRPVRQFVGELESQCGGLLLSARAALT
jgi:hypothetical protein